MPTCLSRFFVFSITHVEWPRSNPTVISLHRNGFNRGYCLGVMVRPSEGVWMVVLHMQHFCSWRGMQMKREEPHFNFGAGHENDLTNTCNMLVCLDL